MTGLVSLLYTIALIVYADLAVIVLYRNIRSRLNWFCALFLLSLACWSLEDIFHGNPALPAAQVDFFSDIGAIGRFSLASFFLAFVLEFTGSLDRIQRRRFGTGMLLILLAGLPVFLLVMYYCRQFPLTNHHYSFGWVVEWQSNNLWVLLFYCYLGGFVSFGSYLLYRFAKEGNNPPQQKSARILGLTTLASLILGGFTDIILPLTDRPFPELAGLGSLIWAGGLYYSIGRYNLLALTPSSAADEILATMPEALFLITPEGRIAVANPAGLELFGYQQEELPGIPAADLFASAADFDSLQVQTVSFTTLSGIELQCRTKTGREFPAVIATRVLRTDNGSPGRMRGIVMVLHDISAQKQAAAKLRQAQEELLRQERLATMGQIAGGIAHELRAPLGTVSNSLYYLRELSRTDIPEAVRRHLEIIERQLVRANETISALLDFGRNRTVQQEPVALQDLLSDTLADCVVPPHITLRRIQPEHSCKVLVDPRQARIIFRNLVRNAIQAMPETGELTITVESPTAGNTVAVHIRDTGRGIAPEDRERIFDPFFTTKSTGTGLGLAISKSLVEQNQGTITVQSEPGSGTTFTVALRRAG